MYEELNPYQQLLLAIEFHLKGSAIPRELVALLGDQLVSDVTNPIVNEAINDYSTSIQPYQ